MTKYLYLFRGGDDKMKDASPDEMQVHMQKWGEWMKSLASDGVLVDGLPLSKEGKCIKDSGNVVTDGPYAEGNEVVGGYLIVKTDSLDSAVAISKNCPIFDYDGQVEVREIQNMDM